MLISWQKNERMTRKERSEDNMTGKSVELLYVLA